MFQIEYEIDYSSLIRFTQVLKARLGENSNLVEAIQTAGRYAVKEWVRIANGKFTHSQGSYVNGIMEGIKYPYQNDPLQIAILNKAPHARALEYGMPEWDMKEILATSSKVRISKDGKRYLIIPFRHGIPSTTGIPAMPKRIYQEAKNLRQSTVTNTFKEGVQQRYTKLENPIPSEKVAGYIDDAKALQRSNPIKVKRNQYSWGERLTGAGGIYEGMYRFEKNVKTVREDIAQNTPLGKFTYSRMVNKTENNTAYSNYITFRVMSEGSLGWIRKPTAPMNILKETKEVIEQPIIAMLKEAVKADMKAIGLE